MIPGVGAYDARPWLSSYPEGVPHDVTVPTVALTDLLDSAAREFPFSGAVTCDDVTLSYSQLRLRVNRLAGGLAKLGVRPGDRVALVLPNTTRHVVAFFAVLRLGAVAVPVNPLATADELRQLLSTAGVTVAICLDRAAERLLAVREQTPVRHIVVTGMPGAAARQVFRRSAVNGHGGDRHGSGPLEDPSVVDYAKVLRSRAAPQATIDPATAAAVLLPTGGTSGEPRLAALSHRNLLANAQQVTAWLPAARRGREVTLASLPLFHVFGLTLGLLATIRLAGRLVLLPRFDISHLLALVEREQPTLFPAVPPVFQALLDSPGSGKRDFGSVRACISGGMRLPEGIAERFEAMTGARLIEGYGMTETAPATLCTPVSGDRRPGSVGLPLPGTRPRIVDPEDSGRELPVGEVGELAIRGDQVFLGYVDGSGPPRAATDHDGWLLTGDIARMDPDGWFTIVDRKRDVIIAGGFNVFPSEVERVILELPGVADCCVVGLPDRYRGETVKAYVVPVPGATVDPAAVREFSAARLSAYKVPKLVEIRSQLPRTAVGKALRRQLVADEMRAAEVTS